MLTEVCFLQLHKHLYRVVVGWEVNCTVLCGDLLWSIFKCALSAVIVAPVVICEYTIAQDINFGYEDVVNAAVGVVIYLEAVECA